MTTLVATQRALELLSMSNQQGRRQSKRLAAAADFERDDDFQFVRKSKRAKTDESAGSRTTQRGRTVTEPDAEERITIETIPTAGSISLSTSTSTAPGARKSSRRKGTNDVPQDEAPQTTVKPTRKSPRGAAAQRENSTEGPRFNGASQAASPTGGKASKPVRRWEPSPTPRRPTESKIALPISDTPIINRNKEMRKKGGKGNRRSSLGSRGRRASSLIESGQTAIPHRDVNPTEFYKHIETEGLIEPKRMMQLLMWCGERALPAKPHGTPNSSAILGARAIQDQILKDFAQRSEFFNWFSRDEHAPKQTAILKPNPRNIELDEKLTTLEANIKKLQEEKQAWLAIRQPPPDMPPIFTSNETLKIELPDFNLLEPREVTIRNYLADELIPFANVRSETEERIRKIQTSLEFEVDQLADNVHKLEQRVLVAGRQADNVLSLSAQRLKEREQKEKKSAGTRDMPVMEVLRSLSNILPEGNG